MPKLTHRYYKWKANQFGQTKLDWWDRNAPLPHSSETLIKWTEAKDIILDSFSSFHPEISNLAKLFFKNNWIDASLRKGKASGAFAHPSVPSPVLRVYTRSPGLGILRRGSYLQRSTA